MSQIPEATVREIHRAHKPGEPGCGYRALGKRFGLSEDSIQKMLRGISHRDIWREFHPGELPPLRSADFNALVLAAIAKLEGHAAPAAVAIAFDIPVSRIYAIWAEATSSEGGAE